MLSNSVFTAHSRSVRYIVYLTTIRTTKIIKITGFWYMTPCSFAVTKISVEPEVFIIYNPKMEGVSFSKVLLPTYQIIWRHIRQDVILPLHHVHCRTNKRRGICFLDLCAGDMLWSYQRPSSAVWLKEFEVVTAVTMKNTVPLECDAE